MATDKAPTKAEFLEALNKKGIKNLEDLMDAIMPETGGYEFEAATDGFAGPATALSNFFSFGFGALDDYGHKPRPAGRPDEDTIPGLR